MEKSISCDSSDISPFGVAPTPSGHSQASLPGASTEPALCFRCPPCVLSTAKLQPWIFCLTMLESLTLSDTVLRCLSAVRRSPVNSNV